MKHTLIFSLLFLCGTTSFARQQADGSPLGAYEELTDTRAHDGREVWERMSTPVRLGWGSTDIR